MFFLVLVADYSSGNVKLAYKEAHLHFLTTMLHCRNAFVRSSWGFTPVPVEALEDGTQL